MKTYGNIRRYIHTFILILFGINVSMAQNNCNITPAPKTNYPQYIVSGMLISYGIYSLFDKTRQVDHKIRDFSITKLNGIRNRSDDFTQYIPALSVYALNAFDIKGKHSWQNATIIYAGSMAFVGALVLPTKYTAKRLRPDNSSRNSFPSGHTATAFASAEFLRREYSDVSPLIGIAGYAIATYTGAMRIANNRHWLSDVVTGAGIGILSTTLSYCIYENVMEPRGWNFSVTPVIDNNSLGISYTMVF